MSVCVYVAGGVGGGGGAVDEIRNIAHWLKAGCICKSRVGSVA